MPITFPPTLLIILGIIFSVVAFIIAASWRVVVPKGQADVVVSTKKTFVCSGNPKFQKNYNKATYYAIPSWIPGFGRTVRSMDLTTKELKIPQETYEKGQARYLIDTSTKYRIVDVDVAAETIHSGAELKAQIDDVIKAGVREVTIKYDVINARAKKQEMETEIRQSIESDFRKWGLELVNFQLVNFQDTEDSKIISNISKIKEKEIESDRRERNAEKEKQALIKEAESTELSRTREIEKNQKIEERDQVRLQEVAKQSKIAKEEELKVKRVSVIDLAEIDKDAAVVKANEEKDVAIVKAEQEKEAEEIIKDQKELEGQGDRLKAEELAKAEAAPILETGNAEAEIIRAKGLAEAEAKDKLQEALNKFKPEAIRTLVAEQIVEKDKLVGIETAKALKESELKVFSGGSAGEKGFQLAELLGSVKNAGDKNDVASLLHRIGTPNAVANLNNLFGEKKSPPPKGDSPPME